MREVDHTPSSNIDPALLEKLDELRRPFIETQKLYVRNIGIGLVAAFIICAIFRIYYIPSIIIAGALGICFYCIYKPIRQYNFEYKDKILPQIIDSFDGFKFKRDGAISDNILTESKIIPKHNLYLSDNVLEGSVKGFQFQYSEAGFYAFKKFVDRSDSTPIYPASNTSFYAWLMNRTTMQYDYNCLFKGMCLSIQLPENSFEGHTVLVEDKGGSAFSKWIAEKSLGLKRADLVDLEFQEIFDVYTDSQLEARYLIDPLIIENIKEMYHRYEQKGILAAFYKGQILLLINIDKSKFNPPSLYTPLTNESTLNTVKEEIAYILSLIDSLRLFKPFS